MTEIEFWTLIEKTRAGDPEEQVERLHSRLVKLPVEVILSFGYWWDEASVAAYDWNLWGAAYLINGGCSDDGFTDFRTWLILRGEKIYRAALADPDSLAELAIEPDSASCECYPAPTAFAEIQKPKGHDDYYAALAAAHGPGTLRPEPLGDDWDFDDSDEMKKRLPDLWKSFGY